MIDIDMLEYFKNAKKEDDPDLYIYYIVQYGQVYKDVSRDIRQIISDYSYLKDRYDGGIDNKEKRNYLKSLQRKLIETRDVLRDLLERVGDLHSPFEDLKSLFIEGQKENRVLADFIGSTDESIFSKDDDAISECLKDVSENQTLCDTIIAQRVFCKLIPRIEVLDSRLKKSVGGRPKTSLVDMLIKRLVDTFDAYHVWADYDDPEYKEESYLGLQRSKFVACILNLFEIELPGIEVIKDADELPDSSRNTFVRKVQLAHLNEYKFNKPQKSLIKDKYSPAKWGFGFEFLEDNEIKRDFCFLSSGIEI